MSKLYAQVRRRYTISTDKITHIDIYSWMGPKYYDLHWGLISLGHFYEFIKGQLSGGNMYCKSQSEAKT